MDNLNLIKHDKKYDFVTIGSATLDIFVETPEARIVSVCTQENKNEFMAYPYGSKVDIDNFAFEIGSKCFFHDGKHRKSCAFAGFECNVAIKTIGNNNVIFARQDISCFHIANKIEVACFQKLESFVCQFVAFVIFRTIAKQTDFGIFNF